MNLTIPPVTVRACARPAPGRIGADALHVLVAVDVEGDNVRIITAYRPDSGDWQDNLKTRRFKP